MAITTRTTAASSLAAGTSLGGQVSIADPVSGEQAFLVVDISNASVVAVDSAGWTQVGAQQATGSQAAALFRRTLTGDEDVVTFSIAPTGTRWAATLTVVSGAAVPEGPTVTVDVDADVNLTLGAITPTFADAFVLGIMGANLAASLTPAITAPASWSTLGTSFTTNGSGRIAGAWVGSRQLSGGAGVALPATAATTPATQANAASWVYAFAAAPVPQLTYSAATATGWTVTGAADAQAALSDQLDSTFAAATNPASLVLGPMVLRPALKPTTAWPTPIRLSRDGGTTGTVVARLYSSGGTLIATAPSVSFGTSITTVTPTFTLASLSGTTDSVWTAGGQYVTYTVSAS